jgi:hypothetical protein
MAPPTRRLFVDGPLARWADQAYSYSNVPCTPRGVRYMQRRLVHARYGQYVARDHVLSSHTWPFLVLSTVGGGLVGGCARGSQRESSSPISKRCQVPSPHPPIT